jgi:hypothetical protein
VKSFPPVASDVLASLHRHGILSTRQIYDLHTPGLSTRWIERVLYQPPGRSGAVSLSTCVPPLVASVRTSESPSRKLWYLTPAGVKAAQSVPGVPKRDPVTTGAAAGSLQAHGLAVNDVGIAFVKAARVHGDECGPLDWEHEPEHVIGKVGGRGSKGEYLRPDALLRYARIDGDGGVASHARFIELDRGTKSRDLLRDQVRRYTRLHDYRRDGERLPGWRALYDVFPEVIVVFAHLPRQVMEDRRDLLVAQLAADAEIRGALGPVVSCVLLDDLLRWRHDRCAMNSGGMARCRGCGEQRTVLEAAGVVSERGPYAPIFTRHDRPAVFVDWLGEP